MIHSGAWADASVDPLIRDPRIAACVVGAITGATPPLLADLLRAGCLDPAMLEVALDLVERLCLYDPAAWPTDAGVEWPKVDAHGTGNNPHVWFTPPRFAEVGCVDRQCTCGLYEAGHRYLRASGLSEEGVMARERLRQQYSRRDDEIPG